MLMTSLQFPLMTNDDAGERNDMVKETVGQRIRRARERSGLNQSELARRVGVKPQAVQQWEQDKNYPADRDRYTQIAKVLEVSPHWLEYGEVSDPDGWDEEMFEAVIEAVRGAEMELGQVLPASVHSKIVKDIYTACVSDFAIRQHAKATVPAFARSLVSRAIIDLDRHK